MLSLIVSDKSGAMMYRLLLTAMLLISFMGVSFTGDRRMGGDNRQRSNRLEKDLTNASSPQAAKLVGRESRTVLAGPSGNITEGIGLELVASDLTAPMTAVSPDDGTGRLFIVDQIGVIKILEPDGSVHPEPFLDIRKKLVDLNPGYDERGLLGLAFHPEFRDNGRIFVYYSIPPRREAPSGWDHTNRLSEFRVSRDPNHADPGSEMVVVEADWPSMNHNGGQICFGPDGNLYVPMGDGGGANDTGKGHAPGGNGQDLTTYLGKILRIDVDSTDGGAYGIPEDNPFVDVDGARPEIYACGLRNPAYASFDPKSGLLFIGNAGQELFESIYIAVRGGNYGWNIREGTHCFDPSSPRHPPETCRTTGRRGEPLIGPVVEVGHDLGMVVVGGYVYRGEALPELLGRYIFGDWTDAEIGDGTLLEAGPPDGWRWKLPPSAGDLEPSDVRMWTVRKINVVHGPEGGVRGYVRGFGEDADHELYVMASGKAGPSGSTGRVYRMTPAT